MEKSGECLCQSEVPMHALPGECFPAPLLLETALSAGSWLLSSEYPGQLLIICANLGPSQLPGDVQSQVYGDKVL